MRSCGRPTTHLHSPVVQQTQEQFLILCDCDIVANASDPVLLHCDNKPVRPRRSRQLLQIRHYFRDWNRDALRASVPQQYLDSIGAHNQKGLRQSAPSRTDRYARGLAGGTFLTRVDVPRLPLCRALGPHDEQNITATTQSIAFIRTVRAFWSHSLID
jgi:hypothetical protein